MRIPVRSAYILGFNIYKDFQKLFQMNIFSLPIEKNVDFYLVTILCVIRATIVIACADRK